MGLFSSLMGEGALQRNDRRETIRPARPEEGEITYDPGLVDTLKDEHQGLLQVFGAMQRAGAEGRFTHLAELLEQFKIALLNHIAFENVKFYVYMQNHPGLDAATQDFIATVRKEMNAIARTVGRFVDAHLADTPSHATVARFNEELGEIGVVLVKRIDLEENRLYSLYRA